MTNLPSEPARELMTCTRQATVTIGEIDRVIRLFSVIPISLGFSTNKQLHMSIDRFGAGCAARNTPTVTKTVIHLLRSEHKGHVSLN